MVKAGIAGGHSIIFVYSRQPTVTHPVYSTSPTKTQALGNITNKRDRYINTYNICQRQIKS
jgi:hypothetical protein